MVLLGIFAGKSVGECRTVARFQPILVVVDRARRSRRDIDQFLDALDDQVGREAVEVDVRGMLDPMTLPIVIDITLYALEFLVDTLPENFQETLIFRE